MKKMLFLLAFMFMFFISVSFVCSADTAKNSDDSPVSTGAIANSNNYKVNVSHNKIEQGKDITFTVTVKDSRGNPVVDKPFGFTFRGKSDKSNQPVGRHTVEKTNSKGTFPVFVDGSVTKGWFDYFDLTICDGLDSFQYPKGNVYYRDTFDFTIKSSSTSITLDISKPTVYEGQFTQVKAYVKSNGVPVSTGYLEWTYAGGKNARTLVSNGASVFNYSSYVLGKNNINVKYIGFGSSVEIPGLITSNTGASKAFSVNVKAAPDLIISKITRSGNKYMVTVKNSGEGTSSKTKLKLWYNNKKFKVVNVNALSGGKSKTYTVNFFKYNTHKNYKKYAEINFNKGSYEKNYANNKVSFKSTPYVGSLPDLTITKVSRNGNSYQVTVKNQGKGPSGIFKVSLWYVVKNKVTGLVEADAKFGTYGKTLPSGASVTMVIPYIKYSTHAPYNKFVQVNKNKKVPESNYNNNIKKFK